MSRKKKKKSKNLFLSYLCTVNEICVQCSTFNSRENTQKNKNQKKIEKKKKNLTSTDRVFCLYVFGLYVFGFYINCTVQSWEKGETKKQKIKTFLGYLSLYMLYLLLLVLYLVFWLCLNHWNSVVLHTVVS